MARFRVGQRVRLAWKRTNATSSTPIGMEGEILYIGPWMPFECFPDGTICATNNDCVVLWKNGEDSAALFSQLEPIIPEGHQPAELTVEELLPFLKAREVSDVAV